MKSTHSVALVASIACLAFGSSGQAASAGTGWSASVPITKDGPDFGLGVNSAGDAATAWLSEQALSNGGTVSPVLTRFKPARAAFGPVSTASNPNQYATVDPIVHVDAAGTTTVVYEADQDIWTAERPKRGAWRPARRLTPAALPGGSYLVARFNEAGSAVAVWEGSDRAIYAAERVAAGAWSPARIIAPTAPAAAYPSFRYPAPSPFRKMGRP